MRISTLGYVGKQGVKNIGRNKMFSIASIATMSACIFLFGLFFSIVLNLQHFVKTAEEGVAITVFFDEDATESTESSNDGEKEITYEQLLTTSDQAVLKSDWQNIGFGAICNCCGSYQMF